MQCDKIVLNIYFFCFFFKVQSDKISIKYFILFLFQSDRISIKYFIRSPLAFPADITEIKSAETDLKLEFAARIQIERRRFHRTAAQVTLNILLEVLLLFQLI